MTTATAKSAPKKDDEYSAKDLEKAPSNLKELGLKLLANENRIQEEALQEIARFTKTVMDRANKELEHIRRQKRTVATQLKQPKAK